MPLFTHEKLPLSSKVLHEKFIVPPFSVFNTHQHYFKERMKMWSDIGMLVADGRANDLAYDNRRMDKKKKAVRNGTSIFNPVLCEVLYKWFTIPNSKVLDPFAGGVVRGAMASIFGHEYVGYDISSEQLDFNREYFKEHILDKYLVENKTTWINASSTTINDYDQYDFVLTCPPYYNLEHYTELEEDLSNKATYQEFLAEYTTILKNCSDALKNDSFFAIVVSDVRDKSTTEYYGLVADTITILRDICGLHYYNEIILYNDTGNLAITSGDYLNKARKVGRQHQNVLIFYKGDIKHIKDKFGTFDLTKYQSI